MAKSNQVEIPQNYAAGLLSLETIVRKWRETNNGAIIYTKTTVSLFLHRMQIRTFPLEIRKW